MLVIGMRYREVVVLRETCARDFIEPVGIGESHGLLGIDVAIISTIDSIVLILVGSRIPNGDWSSRGRIQVDAVVGSISHRIESIVQGCLSHRSSILAGVHQLHLRLVGIELCSEVGREVNSHLATLLTFLGGDDDDTIRSTGTIDRSRSGILQNLHTLNIICIEGIQCHIGRHTIYDIKRVLRRVERTDTTNTHGS